MTLGQKLAPVITSIIVNLIIAVGVGLLVSSLAYVFGKPFWSNALFDFFLLFSALVVCDLTDWLFSKC